MPTISRSGHSLMELMAAMVTGSILLAGLASVMFIGREIAYAPTASQHRIEAARIVNELADELRYATFIQNSSPNRIEFVVADRNNPVDGVAERIRYAWSGIVGDPLTKTYNGTTANVAESITDFSFAATPLPPEPLSSMQIALQTSVNAHSRIEMSVPLANRPELLSTCWRHDFDRDPTQTDANADGFPDWELAGGGAFDAASLAGDSGIWTSSNSEIESRSLCDFAGVTTVEARFQGDRCGFRIPADRQNGQYGPLIVALEAQPDGSRKLSLLNETSSSERDTLAEIDDVADDLVRVRVTIDPASRTVTWRVNDIDLGTYPYLRYPHPSDDRYVSLGALDALGGVGVGEFDYIDVRVRPTE